jgi:MFS family permease
MADARGGTFRALRVRNFRLFFVGQVLNVTGSWIHNTAIAWIVVRQHNAAAGVGLIVAMQFLPLLLLGAWAGALADRVDKRRILVAANSAAVLITLGTALLVSGGHRSVEVLAAMAFLLGVTTAFETPTRQSLLGQLVDGPDLPSAIGLNAAIMTGSRMAGSAVAGLLIVGLGSTACIYVNALSFIATIVGVLLMDPAAIRATAPNTAARRGQVLEGIRYAAGEPAVRFTLVTMAVVGTLAINSQVTTPLIARITFHAGPGLFALFGAVQGLGALGGALTTASRKEATVSFMARAALLFGVFLFAVALAPWAALGLVALAASAFCGSLYISTTNARLQAVADDRYRGRVMSLYSILFLGSTPVGSLIVSAIAVATNPRVAMAVGGAAALGTGIVALYRSGRERPSASPEPLVVAPVAEAP